MNVLKPVDGIKMLQPPYFAHPVVWHWDYFGVKVSFMKLGTHYIYFN